MQNFATMKPQTPVLNETMIQEVDRDLSFLRAIDSVDALLADEAAFDELGAQIDAIVNRHGSNSLEEALYIELERRLAAVNQRLRPAWDALKELREAVIRSSGIRVSGEPSYFADAYGVVHKIEERTHTTVEVHPFGIAHTRRPEFGETRGSLSEKEAREHGFTPIINKGEVSE